MDKKCIQYQYIIFIILMNIENEYNEDKYIVYV